MAVNPCAEHTAQRWIENWNLTPAAAKRGYGPMTTPGSQRGQVGMDRMLRAILNDDRRVVEDLLKTDRGLATALIPKPKLYRSQICHWIYAGDTALHLAAAGYRVEIVGLLLAAGADPNAASNHRHSTPLHYAADGFVTCS